MVMTKEARLHNIRKTVSLTNGAGKTGQLNVKKVKLDHSLPWYTKNKLKMYWRPNCDPDTVKFLEEIKAIFILLCFPE